MRTRLSIIALALLALSRPSWGASVVLFAEQARIPTGTSDCTIVPHQGANDSYTTVDCLDAGSNGKTFTLRGYVPTGGATNLYTTKISYYSPDTGVGKLCVWNVKVLSVINGTAEDLVGLQANTTSATNTHSATKEYIATSTGSSTVQKDNGSGSATDCLTTECHDKEARVTVTLNAGLTTATSCKFSSVILDFP